MVAAGWVLLIKEEHEQARVLLAILVSGTFVALQLSFAPLRWIDDGALMILSQVALILAYMCVLVIKSCDMSSVGTAQRASKDVAKAICSTYGLGETPTDLYVLFIFFGLALLLVLLVVSLVRFWVEGHVPAILLVARAHSMSPTKIVRRIWIRRHPARQFSNNSSRMGK